MHIVTARMDSIVVPLEIRCVPNRMVPVGFLSAIASLIHSGFGETKSEPIPLEKYNVHVSGPRFVQKDVVKWVPGTGKTTELIEAKQWELQEEGASHWLAIEGSYFYYPDMQYSYFSFYEDPLPASRRLIFDEPIPQPIPNREYIEMFPVRKAEVPVEP